MMRIMLFQAATIINSKDGASKVYCNMANELVRRKHDVACLVCEDKIGIPFFSLNDKVLFRNIGIGLNGKCLRYKVKAFIHSFIHSFIHRNNERRYIRKCCFHKDLAVRVKNFFREFQPDVVVCNDEIATYNFKEFVKSDVPVITIFHQPPELNLDRIATIVSVDKTKCLRALKSSECLVGLIQKDKCYLEKVLGNKRVEVIPNVVPQLEEYCDYNSRKIITVGRFDREQKRTHYIIEAINLLKEYDWNVEIWGDYNYDPSYYKYCLSLIKKYNLKNIKIMGTTYDVTDRLLGASVFAFPSSYEGFSLALTEAMSVGLPSVGFKNAHSVNELIIDGHNGILCDESVEAFASSLEELMLDVEKRIKYGKNAKEDMKAYSSDIIWNRWEQLIEDVVEEYKRQHSN